jgi:hypothetical protein
MLNYCDVSFTFISFVSLHLVNNYTSLVSLGKNWVALFFPYKIDSICVIIFCLICMALFSFIEFYFCVMFQ